MDAVTNFNTTTDIDLSRVMLITGTGRSGTRWLSRLFAAVGLTTTHEGWFRPQGLIETPPAYTVDASWCGVPWLAHNPTIAVESELKIVHVVRNPLDTIGSFISARVFEVDDPYKEAIGSVIDLTGNVIYDATNWWIQSNRIAARYSALPTIPVERVTVDWMRRVVWLLGGVLPVATAKKALWEYGLPDENRPGRRGGGPLRLRWDNIPEELRWIVQEMAEQFDYTGI